MKKRKILNLLMVLIIALMGFFGVMTVGSLKGWFGNQDDIVWQLENKKGIVTVERNGIAYEVENGFSLSEGDILRTKISSEVSISIEGKVHTVISPDSQVKIVSLDNSKEINVSQGEIFTDSRFSDDFKVSVNDIDISLENAVVTVSSQPSAVSVYVHGGKASADNKNFKEKAVAEAGKYISVLSDEDGNISDIVSEFSPVALNDNQIKQLQNCEDKIGMAFTDTDLEKVLNDRKAEKEKAQQELEALIEKAKEELKDEQEAYDKAKEDYEQALKDKNKLNGAGGSISSGSGSGKFCTIEIRCDTILSNMSNLKPGKEGFVPSNGTILATSRVEFNDGETVFDVLKRACAGTGIQLEYSYTPMYGSYYIEGINNLYEFDCGSQSGWMYKVNGWFPNYGCSKYTVNENDTIVWVYTCNGLGEDVGGSVN